MTNPDPSVEPRARWAPFNTPFSVAADSLRHTLAPAEGVNRERADYVLSRLDALAEAIHHRDRERRCEVYEFRFDDGALATVRVPDLITRTLADYERMSDGMSFEVTGPPLAEIAPGLYRLHWKSGGFSLAAIGMFSDGRRWFAPVNWLGCGIPASSTDWDAVAGAERIEAGPIRGES